MTIEVIGLGASTVDILSLVDHLPAEDEDMRASEIRVQGGGDDKITIDDETAYEAARALALKEGLFVGMSSGAKIRSTRRGESCARRWGSRSPPRTSGRRAPCATGGWARTSGW